MINETFNKCEKEELVSIVIPVYNSAKYLRKCIDSVLVQTYFPIELILVNDGSIDTSEVICKKYEQKYSFIKYFKQKNLGPGAAREAGVKKASGSLIMFIDSDDWIDIEMVETMVRALKESNGDMVACDYIDFYFNYPVSKIKDEFYLDCNMEECIYHIHATRKLASGPWGKLYKKTIFDKVDFYKDIIIGEDYSMLLQIIEKINCARILSSKLYFRCLHSQNISRSGFTSRHKKALSNYLSLRKILIEKYPNMKKEIIEYHVEYEMAVITAMCRNSHFDRDVILLLKEDLRENLVTAYSSPTIPFHKKICAFLIAYCTTGFVIVFKLIHILTGR